MLLPIADGPELRTQARLLARRHRGALARTIALHAAAAAAGLAGPPILGRLVEAVRNGTTRGHVDRVVLVLAGFLVAQTILTWLARRASFVLSEKMFAELREEFMNRVLGLPLSTVERAGTGDLISRTTADVDALTRTIRFAVPETTIATITVVLTVAAAVWVSPLAAIPCIAGVPVLWLGTRWYLKRAPQAYLRESGRATPRSRDDRRDGRGRPHDRGARAERGARAPHRRRPPHRVPLGAVHALPAHDLVPVGRVRLRRAGRGGTRLGRLARVGRPRDARAR